MDIFASLKNSFRRLHIYFVTVFQYIPVAGSNNYYSQAVGEHSYTCTIMYIIIASSYTLSWNNIPHNNIGSPCCAFIRSLMAISAARLGCWLCVTSCRRDDVIDDCGVNSGSRLGTLLARCSCFFEEEILAARTVATDDVVLESAGFVLVLLDIAGVDDLEAENFLRFLLRAARAGPRPWVNMWCASWGCTWWGCCALCISWPAPSKEDFESEEPSDREPPSSDAGEYTESSERDLPENRKRHLFIYKWLHCYFVEINKGFTGRKKRITKFLAFFNMIRIIGKTGEIKNITYLNLMWQLFIPFPSMLFIIDILKYFRNFK